MNRTSHHTPATHPTPADDPFEAMAQALVELTGPGRDDAEAFDVGPLPEAFVVEPPETTRGA